MFKLYRKSKVSQARIGALTTVHGKISTPFFMPIATKAAVKSLHIADIKKLKAQIVLSNTYHLYLQPGMKVIKKIGGLGEFMDWQGPILTDSGGYQVFSLSGTKNRKGNLVKIQKNGVEFRSHLDGSKHFFTPEKVLQIQKDLGVDISMILDVCTANPATHAQAEKDMLQTIAWAKKSQIKNRRKRKIFAIVQGSVYKDLRIRCARELAKMDFDGFAVGGLAVGETNKEMYQVLDYTVPELPEGKPRYLMGVGRPENIVEAVKKGIDMFDCVIPTREARHGRLFFRIDNKLLGRFYKTINIANAKFKFDMSPINNSNLKNYSKAYLHHLFKTGEPLALTLATINNLEFYLQLMKNIRIAIRQGEL